MWHDGGWGWGGWLVMSLMMIIFVGLLIAGVVAIVRSTGRGHPSDGPGPSQPPEDRGAERRRAEDLLAERFARGEIDEEEYQRRLDVLRGRS